MFDLKKPSADRTYTVVPFPEQHPEFTVEARELTDAQINAIYDANKFFPGRDASMSKFRRVQIEIVKKSIVRVEGFTLDGQPVELTDEVKVLLYDNPVDYDGRTTTVWQVVQDEIAKQKAAARGN